MSTPFPDPIIKPFSNTGDNAAPPLGPIATAANQETGFPILESTPLNVGGIPVTREEFNGAFNFYTKQILAVVSGAQFTFNQALSDEQNGYPANAILYDFQSGANQISLIPNNTFNFVTNRTYFNDGTHWRTKQTSATVLQYVQNTSVTVASPAAIYFSTLSYVLDLTGLSPYDPVTGIFTAPATTLYKFEFNISGGVTIVDPPPLPIYVNAVVNGVSSNFLFLNNVAVGVIGFDIIGSSVLNKYLTAGSTVYFRLDQGLLHYGATNQINSITMTWDGTAV
jgi:hypothetical protein